MITVQEGTLVGGKYQIDRCLGAGGMGAVYLARDVRNPDFQVALKVLYPGIIRSQEAKERFRYEINAAYRVSHENVVKAYEFFEENDLFAFAMEYVPGGDLLAQLQTGALPIEDAARVLRQVAFGLEAIHNEGIIHRDLKPENILLGENGVIKISDFGVARLTGGQNLTQDGAMVGTPKYVAPEYVETGNCDHRGDIYALGVIGYECVTGMSPFRSESKRDLIMERFTYRNGQLMQVAEHCPKAFARIIEKAMSISVSNRYQSAHDMGKDIDRFLEGESVKISRSRIKNSAQLPSRKHTIRQRVALMMIVILIGGIGAFSANFIFDRTRGPLSLSKIPQAMYKGSFEGVLADDKEHPFGLWVTQGGVFALLGKENCSVKKVDDQDEFSCGELQFKIDVKRASTSRVSGIIRELGWGSIGTFEVSRSMGEEG